MTIAKDILGREIESGEFVVQAAGQGHDKWLNIAVVLDVIDENNVKVQSQSRPGIVRWPSSRLLILDDTEGMSIEKVHQLNDYWTVYQEKKK